MPSARDQLHNVMMWRAVFSPEAGSTVFHIFEKARESVRPLDREFDQVLLHLAQAIARGRFDEDSVRVLHEHLALGLVIAQAFGVPKLSELREFAQQGDIGASEADIMRLCAFMAKQFWR